MPKKNIAIFIIAYEAVSTFDKVIKRIPKDIYNKVKEIFLIDDLSNDNTYYAAIGYKHVHKIKKTKKGMNGIVAIAT